MCTYNISIDDALMEKVRIAIGEGIDEASWKQKEVELLLIQLTASQKQHVFDNDYMSNLIQLSAPAWKDIKDADSWVHELRG